MSYSVLFCPTHFNQGHRTVCKWCDYTLIPSASHSRFSPPLEATVLPPVFGLGVFSIPFPFDVVHDQFQDLPDVY